MYSAHLSRSLFVLAVAGLGMAIFSTGVRAEPRVTAVVQQVGLSGGICCVPKFADSEMLLELAEATPLLIHALHDRHETVEDAKRRIDAAGISPTRIVVEQGGSSRLPYASRSVDMILLADLPLEQMPKITLSEALRVLRPGGRGIMGWSTAFIKEHPSVAAKDLGTLLEKIGLTPIKTDGGVWAEVVCPAVEGIDAWSHWNHGPDNNPVSRDSIIKAPYMTQWLGRPYYAAMPAVTTAAGGRTFVATGHIAHHPREVPTLNLITARNGYNGQVLWRRDLPDGYLVHRSAFIATDDVFYLMDGDGVLRLDAETGDELDRITLPGLEGTLNWMAIQDGQLFVQAGDTPAPAVTTEVESERDHWSWQELSPGYYEEQVPWGFGKQTAAYDLKRGRTDWVHSEAKPVDSRALGLYGGLFYFYSPDGRIGCRDTKSGELLWANDDPDVLAKIEKPGQGLVSTPGFRSTCMMLCTEDAIVFQGQTRDNLVAISSRTGEFLWEQKKSRNDPTLLSIDGSILTSHDTRTTLLLDPVSGRVVEDLKFRKLNCTRMTASPDALFCRGEGLGRFDRESGRYLIDGSVRPGCNDGAIPANGLLYIGPWCCDCNLSLIGTVTLASAESLDDIPAEQHSAQLDRIGSLDETLPPIDITDADWPTYRANNTRGSASPVAVSDQPKTAWHYKPKVECRITAPTVVGSLAFIGREDGKVVCLDTDTKKVAWEFITAGPVLQPPTIWESRAYVGSGDGHVYCLEARTGRLLWRYRASPVTRKVMVYGALCSTWPVNSGVLVHEGRAYFAAGIIDRDGTYVTAVDAISGERVWCNDTCGILDPVLRKGVSAQGGLAVARGRLWLAAGNQVSPASFDLQTGEYQPTIQPPGPPLTPRGADIGVWLDSFIVHGGKLLYSDHDKVISPGVVAFTPINAEGAITSPGISPTQRSSTSPAWNDAMLVSTTDRYDKFVCWDSDLLADAFALRRQAEAVRRKAMQRAPDQGARNRIRWTTDPIFDDLIRHTGKWGPIERETMAIVLSKNYVVTVSGPAPWNKEQDADKWIALGHDVASGKNSWWQTMPSVPVANGVAIGRDGRIVIAMQSGEVCVLQQR